MAWAKNAAIVVATLIGAALLVVGLAVLGARVLAWFLDLKAGAMTAVSTVAVGLAVAVTTGVITRRNERRRLLEEPVRARKTEFYDTLISDLMQMFNLGSPGSSGDPAAIQQMFVRTPAPMLTFASRRVIVAWNELRQAAIAMSEASAAVEAANAAGASLVSSAETDPRLLIERVENLLKAVRRDLGHSVCFTKVASSRASGSTMQPTTSSASVHPPTGNGKAHPGTERDDDTGPTTTADRGGDRAPATRPPRSP